MRAVRDWAALAGAVAMVGFLTFVPHHAPVAASAVDGTHRHADIAWPSRLAALAGDEATRR